MTQDVITLPAYWSSALINDDFSYLEEADPEEAKRVRALVKKYAKQGVSFVGIAEDEDGNECEPHFTWSYGLYDPGADVPGGEVLDYLVYTIVWNDDGYVIHHGLSEAASNALHDGGAGMTQTKNALPWQTSQYAENQDCGRCKHPAKRHTGLACYGCEVPGCPCSRFCAGVPA